MVSTTYSTGSWLGIVRSGSVVVLDGQTDPAIVKHLWDYLGQEPTIHGVLNEVTEKFGTGLTSMPDFAVVVQSDRLHVILRGDITLLAHTGAGTELVSGRDVTTWSERSLPLADSIELTLAEPGAEDGTLGLPLGEGVVRLQSLTILTGVAGSRISHTYDGDQAATVPSGAEAVPPAVDAQLFVADATPFAAAPFDAAAAGAEDSTDDAPEWTAEPENLGEVAAHDEAGNELADDPLADGFMAEDSVLDGFGSSSESNSDAPAEPEPRLFGSLTEPAADFEAAEESREVASIPGDHEPVEPEPYADNSDLDDRDADNPDLGNRNINDPAAGELAGAEPDEMDPDNIAVGPDDAGPDDDETLASFAKAAEAADAEWNAQLAPMDAATHHGADDDLSRTIRPDMGDEMDQLEAATEDDEPEAGEEPEEAAGETADNSATVVEEESAAAAEEPADDGFTINYDYLFGATTMAQSVEAAAVRLDENGQPVRPENMDPVLPPRPPQPPMVGSGESALSGTDASADTEVSADGGQPGGSEEAAGSDLQTDAAGHASAPEAAPASTQSDEPENLLIDSVPWSNSGSPAQLQAEPADYVNAQSAQDEAGQHDPVLDDPAPGAAADADAATPSNGPAVNGASVNGTSVNGGYDPDHDGHTVVRGDFTRDGQPADPTPLESRPPTGPMVLARMCHNGHANPPSRSRCSSCGAAINSEPREVGRPRLGTMHISTGELVELDHSLIIGRQPSVSRVMGGAMPRLVQVKSGNDDISRSHVEVRLDGWEVLLVDLKATNGTVLVREGQAPRRLSQGEEAILLNGDIAELGDGVSLLFDGLL